jgi:ribonuclease T1
VLSIGLPSVPTPNSTAIRLAVRRLGLALWVAGGLLVSAPTIARNAEPPAGMPTVALATLPAQAQTTYRLILDRGPFPYHKDGTVFGNREKRLPMAARGHYREYTVKTPGVSHRGARRIVCGGEPPNQPEACFYTDDHYASFRLIAR